VVGCGSLWRRVRAPSQKSLSPLCQGQGFPKRGILQSFDEQPKTTPSRVVNKFTRIGVHEPQVQWKTVIAKIARRIP
jgi:hypothetical protein